MGTWLKPIGTLIKWFVIAFAVLGAGGFFARGLSALWRDRPIDISDEFKWALLVFAAGGGLAIAVLIVAWRVSSTDLPGKVTALIVLMLLAGAVVIWPTPYKYYRKKDLSVIVRINRLTGVICYQLNPAAARPPTDPAAAPSPNVPEPKC